MTTTLTRKIATVTLIIELLILLDVSSAFTFTSSFSTTTKFFLCHESRFEFPAFASSLTSSHASRKKNVSNNLVRTGLGMDMSLSSSSDDSSLSNMNTNSESDSSDGFDYVQIAKDVFKKDKRPVILFDGVCNLCNGGVNFALDNDSVGKFTRDFIDKI